MKLLSWKLEGGNLGGGVWWGGEELGFKRREVGCCACACACACA